jgi:hypothetical protein
MTKRTKYILLAVSGLGIAGAALVVCVVLIVGVIYLSSQTTEAQSDHSPITIKKQPKKSDGANDAKSDDSKVASKVDPKLEPKVSDDDRDLKTTMGDLKTSKDSNNSTASKNDSDEQSDDETKHSDEQSDDETDSSAPTDLAGE